jgi:hypothetical protein
MFVHKCVGLRGALLFLGAVVLGVAPAWAQAEGIVRGQVVAAADASTLAQASVRLIAVSGDSVETTTDDSGSFVFQRVRPGEYMLSATAEGFGTNQTRVLIEPRDVRVVTIPLEVGAVAVNVTVSAELAMTSTHSPSSTLVVADRFEMLPVSQRTNLPDVLVTLAPGMIRGHDDFVHIRGHEVALNPSINGVQFWENAHAVFSPGLGVDYIESVNVMTGGFPAEYGNRFGGILDVVTKSGLTMRDRGSISLGVGSAQRHNVGFDWGGRSDRAAYYVNASGFTSDRFLSPPSPRSIHNTGRGLRSFGRVDFRANNNNDLELVVMGDGVNFDLPMDERDAVLRPDFKNVQRTRSQTLIVSWDHVRSSELLVQAAAYQRWSVVRQHPETIDRYGAQTDAERSLSTVGVKSDVARLLGRHTVKGGIDLSLLRPREEFYYLSQPWIDFTHVPAVNESHVHFRGPNLGAGIPRPVVFNERKTGGQASLFVQDKVQLTSGFTVDAGVRFDHYSLAI